MERITALVMRGVTRQFGTTTALSGFDLHVTGGHFVSLLGPSGCGKSTALNCLAGLLDLSAGEILVNGQPVQHVPAEKRGFGMVFQNYALFPHLTVARNVSYGLEIRGVPKEERAQRVQRALAMVHLEDFGNRFPGQLSGGQQQRLAIARTTVLEPSLLLLDEPLSNLDANLRTEMRVEIKRIHAQLGLTTVYVTHDQSEAMSMSDVVVVMNLGRIEQIGAPQEIYNRPQSRYVATFMGFANQLPGLISGREGDHWLVETSAGRLQATCTMLDQTGFATGQPVTLCFRPEETLLGAASVNQLQGQVQLVEYLGKAFEAVVALAGASAEQLLVQSPQPPEVNTTIPFAIRPDRLLVFPAGESAKGTANVALPAATPQRRETR